MLERDTGKHKGFTIRMYIKDLGDKVQVSTKYVNINLNLAAFKSDKIYCD